GSWPFQVASCQRTGPGGGRGTRRLSGPAAMTYRAATRMAVERTSARIAAALAGPLLIMVCVPAVLHGYAFSGLLSTRQIDLLAQWLPNYCFLGKSLTMGHVPA